jgi:glycosyltransferase involved in cell wall biosynthesis
MKHDGLKIDLRDEATRPVANSIYSLALENFRGKKGKFCRSMPIYEGAQISMTRLQRIAFIGNHSPRMCGIATFTDSLRRAVSKDDPNLEAVVVAMTETGAEYEYPREVVFEIREDLIDDYAQAAEFLNSADVDVVSLQHEYGIFGGESGNNIVQLLSRLKMPIVTTLHTVLTEPTPMQRKVMDQIVRHSAKIIVMAEKGRELLQSVHDVPAQMIEVIPHGIPDFPFLDSTSGKDKHGLEGKSVILTFGLLSPNKGIETTIDAMPRIIEACPNAVYVVLGATHPNLLRDQGETYRDSLTARARKLGLEDHVFFFNQFVGLNDLLDFIAMSDLYVSPYLNEAQITSGALAYSFGLGKAIVSTPYWHAQELLDDGRGVLVPFRDSEAISREIIALLTDDARRNSMRQRAYVASRSMTWEQTAKRYTATFDEVRNAHGLDKLRPVMPSKPLREGQALPEVRVDHFLSLCDGTGMLQHALYSAPNPDHGYCIDDNARALLFSNMLHGNRETHLPERVTACFAAFIQRAWNPESRRFRNFMSYGGEWLEESGSEDSHGRTLWALGECARADVDLSRRKWAASLFKTALPAAEEFTSPRAWAFSLLGLDAYFAVFRDDLDAARVRRLLADRLIAAFHRVKTKDWIWFEEVLAYDNARLSQALIQTGTTTNTPTYVNAGLQSLRWLMELQTAPAGHFRPIGNESFGRIRQNPKAFDQQPLEASATIAACLAALRANRSAAWTAGAFRAFGWFLGDNDIQTSLIDLKTGACADGLHADRRNENKGAESTLSYLLGLAELREFARTTVKENNILDAQLTRGASRSGFYQPAQMPNAPHAPGQSAREAV